MRRNFLIRSGLAGLWILLAGLAPFAAAAAGKEAAGPVLLVLGDSLSAEYGLPRGTGWVQLLANRLHDTGSDYRVVNASISGETTSGGRTRLPALLKQHQPRVVVLELGANDGLRGLPLNLMKDNLAEMVRVSQAAGARVLLVGIRIPPNYGREYTQAFAGTYAALAQQDKVALVPFLLEPVARDRANFQDDNLHPVAAAQPALRDHVWKTLGPMLK